MTVFKCAPPLLDSQGAVRSKNVQLRQSAVSPLAERRQPTLALPQWDTLRVVTALSAHFTAQAMILNNTGPTTQWED